MRPCGVRWWHIGEVAPLAERLRGARRSASASPCCAAPTSEPDDRRGAASRPACPPTARPRVRAVAFERADVAQVLLGTGLVRLAAMLLRRPTLDVVIAVSPQAWRTWQRSLIVAVTLGAAGAGLVAFGIATGAVPAIVFGAIFLVASWVLRARAVRAEVGRRALPADSRRGRRRAASRPGSTTMPAVCSRGRSSASSSTARRGRRPWWRPSPPIGPPAVDRRTAAPTRHRRASR